MAALLISMIILCVLDPAVRTADHDRPQFRFHVQPAAHMPAGADRSLRAAYL